MKNGSLFVAGFDVHNRQFVFVKVLQVKRTLQGHVDQWIGQIQDGIEQADQANFVFD
jgi:hypothetical protein